MKFDFTGMNKQKFNNCCTVQYKNDNFFKVYCITSIPSLACTPFLLSIAHGPVPNFQKRRELNRSSLEWNLGRHLQQSSGNDKHLNISSTRAGKQTTNATAPAKYAEEVVHVMVDVVLLCRCVKITYLTPHPLYDNVEFLRDVRNAAVVGAPPLLWRALFVFLFPMTSGNDPTDSEFSE